MPSDGPKAPTIAVSDAAFGIIAWANTNNSLLDDGSFATVALSNVDVSSQYLEVTGFGFSIPINAIIDGIQVDIKRKGTQVTDSIKDTRIRMIRSGVIGINDKSLTGTAWPTTEAYQSYGGPSDLWGDSWTPAIINSSNFGFTVAVTTAGLAETASIDFIRITVFFHIGSSINNIRRTRMMRRVGS